MRLKVLHPLIGRKEELDRVIQTLGRYREKNPVLVGELGVGNVRSSVASLNALPTGLCPGFCAKAS